MTRRKYIRSSMGLTFSDGMLDNFSTIFQSSPDDFNTLKCLLYICLILFIIGNWKGQFAHRHK